jgi:hypothetical protein
LAIGFTFGHERPMRATRRQCKGVTVEASVTPFITKRVGKQVQPEGFISLAWRALRIFPSDLSARDTSVNALIFSADSL